jgi:hypothetical protein
VGLDAHGQPPVDKAQVGVARQRAGQQPRLAQHLKAVADAQHGPAVAGKGRHRAHDRGKARQRPGAQVVAVGKPAGHDHRVDAGEVGVAVPQQLRLAADQPDGVGGVALVTRAGKPHDANAGGHARRA